ncbi:MAG: NAD(+)/NADH kinase [Elusimicrobia bacterium]|nr:NAD(+)/NADH kinase [Elusimicrobiota bacterium]
MTYEKIVLVTRKTRFQELVERFNTKGQAKFYIEHAGGDFSDYEREDAVYRSCLDTLHKDLVVGLKIHVMDRSLVPTCVFTEKDIIVTVGQDGLVANCAKYVGGQPIVAVNPDPERFDGVLLPFKATDAQRVVGKLLFGLAKVKEITLAQATLNDGQRLLAFNDLFIGARTHVSARYKIQISKNSEAQSSSGIIVSTGAGSTGWLSSVFNMANGITHFTGGKPGSVLRMDWEDRRLFFAVREPFASKHSKTGIVSGLIDSGEELVLESLMPSDGVIFSDGVEADFLKFTSGFTARIRTADQKACLVMGN